MGKVAGVEAAKFVKSTSHSIDAVTIFEELQSQQEEMDYWYSGEGKHDPFKIMEEMRNTMKLNVFVYREKESLQKALDKIRELKNKFNEGVYLKSKVRQYNRELEWVFALKGMLDESEAICIGALAREECRGSHWRLDHLGRNDEKFLKHSLVNFVNGEATLRYKDVIITKWQPEARTY